MIRLLWANDIHLDFLDEPAIDGFLKSIQDSGPDLILLAGDISTAPSIERHLRRFEDYFDVPVCFVLGNHDYYLGSVEGVRRAIGALVKDSRRLHWLNVSGVYPLTSKSALIGHDGWGDARVGNPMGSPVELSDFYLIDELRERNRDEQVAVMRRLGDEAAAHVDDVLPSALEQYTDLIFLTHVPPFREASWYDGQPSNDNWAPFFTCRAVGDRLLYHMERFPDRQLTVLCGHTHGNGTWQALPNLKVVTGGATYGRPSIQSILEIG